MFSIVIPLYNKEKYITSTLRSVLNQSFKNFELILVNDGSTDRSVEKVKEFNDPRIKLIHQSNQGVSVARNRGIREARFEWIAFLDADDRWGITFLENIAKAIVNYPNNSIFSVVITWISGSESRTMTNDILPKEGQTGIVNFYEHLSKYHTPINSSNSVIRKQLLDNQGGFRIGQRNYEDQDLWIRICINEPVIFINKRLCFIIRNDSSARTGIFLSKDFISFMQTMRKVKNQLSTIDRVFFKKFYNKFVILTFLSYKQYYSPIEILALKEESRKLLKFPYGLLFNFFVVVNVKFENLVNIVRFVKRIFLIKK